MFGSGASIITGLCYSFYLILDLYCFICSLISVVLFVSGFMWWRPVLEMDVSGDGWKVIMTVGGDSDLRRVKKMYEEDVNDEGRRC